jgi:4-hydroxybenzoate polyprenyltransferase
MWQKLTDKLIHLYFYGSIHIALAAAAMTWQSYHLLSNSERFNEIYLLAVFFGSIAFYNYHRLTDLTQLKELNPDQKYQHIYNIRSWIRNTGILAAAISLIILFFLKVEFLLILGICSIITLLYSRAFISKMVKLKELGRLKIFLIAFVWAMLTAWIPARDLDLEHSVALFAFLERTLFILALTLPFDMRDQVIDKKLSIKTIPVMIGSKNSLFLAVGILILFQPLFSWILYSLDYYSLLEFILFLITNIIISLFVWRSLSKQNDLYFTGVLDASMIFQAAVFLIFST